jgi:hypothetical protein
MRLITCLVLLFACGREPDRASHDNAGLTDNARSSPATSDKAERALSEMRGFADRMCACSDADCRKQIRDDYDAWGKTELGQLLEKVPKGQITDAQRKQIDPIEARIRECRRR